MRKDVQLAFNVFGVIFCYFSAATGQNEGDLRLTPTFGSELMGYYSGRLEIYHNSTWGTLCNDRFNLTAANVACRQLGYGRAANYGSVGPLGYPQVTSSSTCTPIWLDVVSCSGTESRLSSCQNNGYRDWACNHYWDVALVCTSANNSYSEGDLRLVSSFGSTSGNSGRLEIYHNLLWGTVCEDSFDSTDADVACRQLGFTGASHYFRADVYGFSAPASIHTPTWLDEVSCFGNESTLASCRHSGYGVNNCVPLHYEDIALVCTIGHTKLGDLRLVSNNGSTSGSSGRLEIYYRYTWGTVCADNFSSSDAYVACRQLGYQTASMYGRVEQLGFSQASSSTPIWLYNLFCHGSERSLEWCGFHVYGNNVCDHEIAILCAGQPTEPEGTLRLVFGNTTGGSFGRLEIYHNSLWGTVCDQSFDFTNAHVACRQLGYANASRYGNVTTLGYLQASSSTPIWLDVVQCSGTESRLASCRNNGYWSESCGHDNDVALTCIKYIGTTNATNVTVDHVEGKLRLNNFGLTGTLSGRLEIYHDFTWGTVCSDFFDSTDANVACKQLGYSGAVDYGSVGQLGYSQASLSTPTWLDKVSCNGYESRLASCSHNGFGNVNCSQGESIAIICSSSSSSSVAAIPLALGLTAGCVILGFIGVILCALGGCYYCKIKRPGPRRYARLTQIPISNI